MVCSAGPDFALFSFYIANSFEIQSWCFPSSLEAFELPFVFVVLPFLVSQSTTDCVIYKKYKYAYPYM